MPNKGYSRRKFLGNIAAGSTGAALAAMPAGHSAAAAADPPYPATMASYPLATANGNPPLENVKVVTTDVIPKRYREKLLEYSPSLKLQECRSLEAFHREVADSHVIFAELTRQDFAAAKQLRWIQARSAGVEEYVAWPELVDGPVILTNMQRIYAPGISETAIGYMLTLAHGLNKYALQTKEQVWKQADEEFMHALSARRFQGNRDESLHDPLQEISGFTLGIVGLGGIGTDIAYRAHYGFGMKILAIDPKPLPKPAFVAELHSVDWLPKMVPRVDILACCAPHTKESFHMLNESVFRAMKPSAYFINVTRGWLVDQSALAGALKDHRIAGAALDATEPEPLPADDPLWTAGNVLITSHTSARSPQTDERVRNLFCENVRRYVNGLPLLNVVDKERGY